MSNLLSDNPFEVIVKDFSLYQTLECGQCFRYYKVDKDDYIVLAKDKMIRIKQERDKLHLNCSEEEYHSFWKNYFDLDRDYKSIKDFLSQKDHNLKQAIDDKHGVRILQQDPWEMLISFILSQTKQIPHIQKLIETLSSVYGSPLGSYDNVTYYSFPTPKQLTSATEERLRELKVGFRAAYIVDAVMKIKTGNVDLEKLWQMTTDQAREQLKLIKGVGDKIADCVLLFGYNRYDVFPVDVWVKRVVETYYPINAKNMSDIQTFVKNYFGDYAGFAQQYLFYYARENKLGK